MTNELVFKPLFGGVSLKVKRKFLNDTVTQVISSDQDVKTSHPDFGSYACHKRARRIRRDQGCKC